MSILSWTLIGLAVGMVTWPLAGGRGFLEDAILGVVGGIVGGWLFVILTGSTVTTITLPGSVAALAAAGVFVALARSLTRRHPAI